MTHTLHTHYKSENFDNDDFRVYLTRDLTWTERNHPSERIPFKPEGAWAEGNCEYDPVFMKRLAVATNSSKWSKDPGVMWGELFNNHQFLLEYFRKGELEQAHDCLNLMYQGKLMDGITQGAWLFDILNRVPEAKDMVLMRHWDVFLGVMEYLGVMGPQNHEQGASFLAVPINKLLENTPPELVAPRWQGGLWGLNTSKGVFGERDLMAFYIALKIREKYPKDSRILEIGGGAGYVAYWLYQFGYRNIFMVDIPSIAACQAYQLAANIGAEHISLANELHDAPIKFIAPELLPHRVDKFNLVVNCDSMPEMDSDSLHTYLKFISNNALNFYSINQEARSALAGLTSADTSTPELLEQFQRTSHAQQQHVIRSIIKKHYTGEITRVDRSKFWLRDGYAEEWYYTKLLLSGE